MIIGGTFVRYPFDYDYPIYEAIVQANKICDKVIVIDGSPEGDVQLNCLPKAEIVHHIWDPEVPDMETQQRNFLLEKLKESEADWWFLFDADEMFSDTACDYLKSLALSNIPFDIIGTPYIHFMRDYEHVVKDGYGWNVKREFLIKADKGFMYGPVGGNQGNNKCPHTLLQSDGRTPALGRNTFWTTKAKAACLHYGWAREESAMARKQNEMDELYTKLWGRKVGCHRHPLDFRYEDVTSMPKFQRYNYIHNHPAIMEPRIASRQERVKVIYP